MRDCNDVEIRGGAEKILHFGSKVTSEIEFEVSFSDETNGYKISLNSTADDKLFVSIEKGWFWDKSYPKPYAEVLSVNSKEAALQKTTTRISNYVRQYLESCRVYHFHDTSSSSPMKKSGDINDNRAYRNDGSNIAAYLYLLKTKYPASYNQIRNTVQSIAPYFKEYESRKIQL